MSTDDESFHPLGQEWEGELEEMLDDTEYDTDLGMEMAQDAMRVTKGELSEAEFHEMYHDDVMEEFDVDDRPTKEAYEQAEEERKGTAARMLDAFDGDGEETRRETMKKMGVGAAAVGLGAWGTTSERPEMSFGADGEEGGENEGTQLGMAIDLERCDGCLSCVTACAEENNLDQGVNWMYVLEYEDAGKPETSETNRLVRPCQHCTDAPCEKVCPTTARHTRDEDGLVLTDYDVCIGCRYCQVACPYGVNYFQWGEPDVSTDDIAEANEGHDGNHMTTTYANGEERWVDSRAPRGTMSKCTMCPTRQDGDMGEDMVGTTACEEACPPDAIQFGDMNDSASAPQQYVDNPSRSRTLAKLSLPSVDNLEEALEDADDDIESVLEATDFSGMGDGIRTDEQGLGTLLAVQITADGMGEGDGDIADYEEEVLAVLEALEDHGLDLESQETLSELGLADPPEDDEEAENGEEDAENGEEENGDEDEEEEDEFEGPDEGAAQFLLDEFGGIAGSSFKLLEEVGTNPNVVYLGNEPGPNAEQREPTGTGVNYGDLSYSRDDGSDPNLVDNRKDVLDEETVGDFGWSL